MTKGRLEAFSDGVIAIIITIMVLELHIPHEPTLAALQSILPKAFIYALSFMFLGIYWNNHHHLLQATRVVDGRVLWANLHLMFWLSLTPVAMSWLSDHPLAAMPVAFYGVVLLMSAIAYYILTLALLKLHGRDSTIAAALGADFKGKASIAIYVAAMFMAFVNTWVAILLYVVVAIIWVVPDRRFERALGR